MAIADDAMWWRRGNLCLYSVVLRVEMAVCFLVVLSGCALLYADERPSVLSEVVGLETRIPFPPKVVMFTSSAGETTYRLFFEYGFPAESMEEVLTRLRSVFVSEEYRQYPRSVDLQFGGVISPGALRRLLSELKVLDVKYIYICGLQLERVPRDVVWKKVEAAVP